MVLGERQLVMARVCCVHADNLNTQVDLVATIPWDLIIKSSSGSLEEGVKISDRSSSPSPVSFYTQTHAGNSATNVSFYRLLRLTRLFKLLSGEKFHLVFSGVRYRMARLLVVAFCMAHWLGCTW